MGSGQGLTPHPWASSPFALQAFEVQAWRGIKGAARAQGPLGWTRSVGPEASPSPTLTPAHPSLPHRPPSSEQLWSRYPGLGRHWSQDAGVLGRLRDGGSGSPTCGSFCPGSGGGVETPGVHLTPAQVSVPPSLQSLPLSPPSPSLPQDLGTGWEPSQVRRVRSGGPSASPDLERARNPNGQMRRGLSVSSPPTPDSERHRLLHERGVSGGPEGP